MKNKKLMYVLLPAVVVVWGLILFRLMDALNEPETDGIPPAPAATKQATFAMPGPVVLHPDYRDPFLGNTPAIDPAGNAAPRFSRPVRVTAMVPTPANTPPAPVAVVWPAVQYVGLIHNGTSQARVALLRINGKSHMTGQGSQADGITVKAIARDSVGLLFGGELKYVRK